MSNSSTNPKLAKTLHFYRIVLHQTQKMELPKKFVSIYGNDLSNIVTLIAPSGREWHVELMKCGAEIWLSNGWKDFADDFCLKYGNLLIFRYEGHSRFYVFMIFDQTTCEIEYPIDFSTSSKNGNHDAEELETPRVEEFESDDSVEIVNDIFRSRKTKKKSPLRRFSSRKRTRSTASIVMQGAVDVKKSEFRMTKRCKTTCEIEYPIDINISSKNCNHDEEELEIPRVEEVESDDSVEIVNDIFRSRKTKKESPLRRFLIRKRTRSTASIVMQGVEDVKKPKFRMTKRYKSKISPKEAGGGTSAARLSSTSSKANCSGSKNLSLESVSELGSVHPFFKVVVTANFLKLAYPNIPVSFFDENIERRTENVTLEFKGKSWPLRIVSCVDGRGRLSRGWHTFASENKLRVGDVCVFEMIKKTNIVFKVSISEMA